MSLSKITTWILYLLIAVSLVFIVMFYVLGTGEETATENMYVDYNLYWAYILVIVGIGTTLVLSILNFVKKLIANPKDAIKSLALVVGVAAVIGISYSISDGTALYMPTYDGPDNVSGWLKFADTLFYTLYTLFAVAIVSVLVSSVAKIFR